MATNTRKRKQTTDDTAKEAVSSIESTITSEISSALAEAVSTAESTNSLLPIQELVKIMMDDFKTGCVPIPLEEIIETFQL